jgi:purine-binding chemotaxis protein CheW
VQNFASKGIDMSTSLVLLLRAAGRTCALPLTNVVEIMRPLQIDQITNPPPFVAGLSAIRGVPTPVVVLARLLGIEAPLAFTRFISLCIDKRTIALAVDSVDGVYSSQRLAFSELPPLLSDAQPGIVEAIGTRDSRLLMVLNAGRILPADVWPMHQQESAP